MTEIDLTTFKKHIDAMVAKNNAQFNSLDYLWQPVYSSSSNYTIEDVENIIDNGTTEEQRLLSIYFFNRDGFYKKLMYYYATLLKYSGILIPNPTNGKRLSKEISKRYNNVLEFIDDFHPEDKWTEIALRVLVEGAYYGVIVELDKKQFTILDLPADYCRSRYKDIYGNDIVEFDIGYFNSFADIDERNALLATYPSIFKKYYNRYTKGLEKSQWLRLPAEIGIMFSFSYDCAPWLLAVIPATLQYDEAVDTERERELDEIRKIIVQKIPHLTSTGDLVFEPDEAEVMHQGAVDMLKGNQNISVLTTYADVEAITSKTSSDNVNNTLEKMVQNIYSQAGVSSQIFAASGTQAIGTSITNDMAMMMILANKFAKVLTNAINVAFGQTSLKFSYVILPISFYNQSDFITDAFKLAQSGYSYLIPGIALGISQRQLVNLKDLENNVLELEKVFIPLQSAYTQSASSDQVGAPEKKLEDKSPKTIQNEDSLDRQGGSE